MLMQRRPSRSRQLMRMVLHRLSSNVRAGLFLPRQCRTSSSRRGLKLFRRRSGTAAGLGRDLFIASKMVASRGGRIEVESTEAEGVTFGVILLSSAG